MNAKEINKNATKLIRCNKFRTLYLVEKIDYNHELVVAQGVGKKFPPAYIKFKEFKKSNEGYTFFNVDSEILLSLERYTLK